MVDSSITFTPNLHLTKLPSNYRVWAQIMNDNLTLMDAAINAFVQFSSLRGAWTNSTHYLVGETVVDAQTAVLWTCQVDHVSASIPTTFLEDSAAHTGYWTTAVAPASNRGAWHGPGTAYNVNDFVLADGTKYAMCIAQNVSGTTFNGDLALGYWTVLVDLSIVGSYVLPVLSGPVDANKFVTTDFNGSSYIIQTANNALELFTSTGTGLNVRADNATLTNPVVGTQAIGNNSPLAASTAYADRIVTSLIPRTTVFSTPGVTTWTPHTNMIYATIKSLGGGGGGGGTASASAGIGTAAGGGGAGSMSVATVTKATAGASQTVTIGAAGTGASAGNNAGGAGGDTSVGTLCIGKGGGGGAGSPAGGAVNGALGGLGGVAGTGDEVGTGEPGGTGNSYGASAGTPNNNTGGSSLWGGGGRGPVSVTKANGEAGTGFGAGGSGGVSFNTGGTSSGGAGTAGKTVITEYCTS